MVSVSVKRLLAVVFTIIVVSLLVQNYNGTTPSSWATAWYEGFRTPLDSNTTVTASSSLSHHVVAHTGSDSSHNPELDKASSRPSAPHRRLHIEVEREDGDATREPSPATDSMPPEVVYAGCPPMNRTVETIPDTFDATAFCAEFGENPWKKPRRLIYGMMFSFELDVLEVVLHEAYPVVDTFVIVESTWSHSKRKKPLFYGSVLTEPRFRPFLSKLVNGTFNARRVLKSGWDYEKRQRRRVLQVVEKDSGIRDGDIFIANLDLDEVFSRKTLMRYKYCATRQLHFHTFGYRYNLNCFMDEQMVQFTRSVILWALKDVPFYDLYKARTAAKAIPLNMKDVPGEMKRVDSQLVWHMSTFGTFEQIRFKLSNSPHRFIDNITNVTLAREIDICRYNNRTRTKLPTLHSHMVPNLIRRNPCIYRTKGWITSDITTET